MSAPSFQFSGSGGPEPAKHGRNWSPSSRWSVNFPQYHVSLKGCGWGWKLVLGQGWQKENASKPAAFQRRKKQHKQRNITWLYHCPPKWMFYFVENFKQYNGWYLVVPPWLRKPPYITYRLGPPNIMLVGLKTQWTSSMSLLYPIVIGVMFANLAIVNMGPTLYIYIYIYIHIHHEAKS